MISEMQSKLKFMTILPRTKNKSALEICCANHRTPLDCLSIAEIPEKRCCFLQAQDWIERRIDLENGKTSFSNAVVGYQNHSTKAASAALPSKSPEMCQFLRQ
jgi:hypothetical protein